jgi:hypothetical protein
VTRRAERIIVQLKEEQEINQSVLEYMNRLSGEESLAEQGLEGDIRNGYHGGRLGPSW